MVRDAAIAYASAGFPVVPVYGINENGCACGRERCKTPGKHPVYELAPNGVLDATTDIKTIASWPDDINIGIALGAVAGGMMVFDIDEPAIMRLLLHPNVGLSDETSVAITGRGAHVWFRCTGNTRTYHLRTEPDDENPKGLRIGEVRGDGAYVVVPPSMSAVGRRYSWVGRKADDYAVSTEVVEDSFSYVSSLLEAVHIAVELPDDPIPEGEFEGGEITANATLPKELAPHLMTVRTLLAGGAMPATERDRSAKLYSNAAEIMHTAERLQYPLTRVALAELIKGMDQVYFHKYTSRIDADRDYMRLAYKVLPEDLVFSPNGAGPMVSLAPDYFWDEDDGALYFRSTPRSTKKVANFKPLIIQDIEIDFGDRTDRAWRVRFVRQGGRSTELLLTAKEMRPDALQEAIFKHCSSDYGIAAGAAHHVLPAMRELSQEPPPEKIRAFAVSGWVELGDEWLYLMPSAVGAICEHGLETSTKIDRDHIPEGETILSDFFEPYGKGVRPPATAEEREQAWEAFKTYVSCGPPALTFLLALQTMTGPLASAGARKIPPLIHLTGRTGTLKTSLCMVVQSMFGTFNEDAKLINWGSTANSAQIFLNRGRDMTLLFDDYKRLIVHPKAAGEIVQTYADSSAKGRATTDQKVRTGNDPRAIMLSNGEDIWENQASTAARCLIVDLKRGDIDPAILHDAQTRIVRGHLQLFGGAYIQWLAGRYSELEQGGFEEIRVQLLDWVQRHGKSETHLRLPGMLASLLAVGKIVAQFITDVFQEPAMARAWLKTVRDYLVEGAREQSEVVEEESPYHELRKRVLSGVAAGKVCFYPVRGVGPDHHKMPDRANAEVIGYWSDETGSKQIMLTRDATFSWYKETLRRSGEYAGFAWHSLLREIIDNEGGWKADRIRVYQGDGSSPQLSGVWIDAELFFGGRPPNGEGEDTNG